MSLEDLLLAIVSENERSPGPWRERAACRGKRTRDWFPSSGETPSKEVRETCALCPVKAQCREHAIAYEHHGIWANTTERERSGIRGRRRYGLPDEARQPSHPESTDEHERAASRVPG